jgi:ABC-type transport system involved in cytochrome c biogenesis permease subunit
LIEQWGIALLLLALTLPYLLPWYAAWFVPFLAFFEDPLLAVAGIFASAVLALTLVPADPFHGLTTPAVLDGVHYGAASVLLVTLIVVAWRADGQRSYRPGKRSTRTSVSAQNMTKLELS